MSFGPGSRRLNEKGASGSFAFRVAKPVHWNMSAISHLAQGNQRHQSRTRSELGLRVKNGLGRGRSRVAQTNPVNAEIFDHSLDVIAGFGKGNPLDPVDRIDAGFAWVAMGVDPLLDPLAAGIIGSEGQDVRAFLFGHKLAEMTCRELGIECRVGQEPLWVEGD